MSQSHFLSALQSPDGRRDQNQCQSRANASQGFDKRETDKVMSGPDLANRDRSRQLPIVVAVFILVPDDDAHVNYGRREGEREGGRRRRRGGYVHLSDVHQTYLSFATTSRNGVRKKVLLCSHKRRRRLLLHGCYAHDQHFSRARPSRMNVAEYGLKTNPLFSRDGSVGPMDVGSYYFPLSLTTPLQPTKLLFPA